MFAMSKICMFTLQQILFSESTSKDAHYKKWISTEDLKEIRESVLDSGVEVEALENQLPCLVVK